MPEYFKKGDILLAIVIRNDEKAPEGTTFLTDSSNEFQVGFSSYKKKHVIKSHIHQKTEKIIKRTQEAIFIKKGSVMVEVLDDKGKKVSDVIMKKGDIIIFISGGHGFKILDDSEIFEIKQGPYMGHEQDKKVFQ